MHICMRCACFIMRFFFVCLERISAFGCLSLGSVLTSLHFNYSPFLPQLLLSNPIG